MTNEPKLAPQAPVRDAADQPANQSANTTGTKPVEAPAPVAAPPADAKKI
jgi:hypothetical protein